MSSNWSSGSGARQPRHRARAGPDRLADLGRRDLVERRGDRTATDGVAARAGSVTRRTGRDVGRAPGSRVRRGVDLDVGDRRPSPSDATYATRSAMSCALKAGWARRTGSFGWGNGIPAGPRLEVGARGADVPDVRPVRRPGPARTVACGTARLEQVRAATGVRDLWRRRRTAGRLARRAWRAPWCGQGPDRQDEARPSTASEPRSRRPCDEEREDRPAPTSPDRKPAARQASRACRSCARRPGPSRDRGRPDVTDLHRIVALAIIAATAGLLVAAAWSVVAGHRSGGRRDRRSPWIASSRSSGERSTGRDARGDRAPSVGQPAPALRTGGDAHVADRLGTRRARAPGRPTEPSPPGRWMLGASVICSGWRSVDEVKGEGWEGGGAEAPPVRSLGAPPATRRAGPTAA